LIKSLRNYIELTTIFSQSGQKPHQLYE
jgi:hypothetical protein